MELLISHLFYTKLEIKISVDLFVLKINKKKTANSTLFRESHISVN
jgi:hypothetical protein